MPTRCTGVARCARASSFPDTGLRRGGRAIPLNTERVGHRYPSYTYEVCREKVREFAEAVGETDPRYFADAADVAGHEIVVPPTFPASFALMARGAVHEDPELGAHWNLLHASQEFSYTRPLRVGDVLVCSPWIVDIKARGRMDMLTLQVDCADADGGHVLESRTSLVFFNEEAR